MYKIYQEKCTVNFSTQVHLMVAGIILEHFLLSKNMKKKYKPEIEIFLEEYRGTPSLYHCTCGGG